MDRLAGAFAGYGARAGGVRGVLQQQLLGGVEAGDGDHTWGHYPDRTPLYEWLDERGQLDPAHPPLKP